MLYTNNLKNRFLAAPEISDFDPAGIAQLTEVRQLRRRFAGSNSKRRLCQIPYFSNCLCIKILSLLLLTSSLVASEIKEAITTYQDAIGVAASEKEKGELHFKLACAFYKDQELDKAFHHFLLALKSLPVEVAPQMSAEEEALYEEALADYLEGGGSNPVPLAKQLLEKYGEAADTHQEWLHLNFLIATAYANLGQFDSFFERFYNAYSYLGETFLAYKTRGILYLRLSQHRSSPEERHAYQEEAFHFLTLALNRNPKDASLYKVLIFLAKDEKNDSLVLNYLQKMVEHGAHISRGDIYLYVREAVALGEQALGQRVIDLARRQYEYSRAISAAQEYLYTNNLKNWEFGKDGDRSLIQQSGAEAALLQ